MGLGIVLHYRGGRVLLAVVRVERELRLAHQQDLLVSFLPPRASVTRR